MRDEKGLVWLKVTCGSRDQGKIKIQIHDEEGRSVIIYLPADIQSLRGVRAKKNTNTNTNIYDEDERRKVLVVDWWHRPGTNTNTNTTTNTNTNDEDEGSKRRGW